MQVERVARAAGPEEGDAVLVGRAVAGDQAAYTTIYQRYLPVVTHIVDVRLGRQGDVADVVQEVFVTAWRRLGALRDPECLRPWLSQIARRAAIDHGRSHRRRTTGAVGDVLELVPDPAPGPADLSEVAELARLLRVGVEGLDHRSATALSLAVDLGFGPAEIAAALGVTEGNAKVILHRARRRLRDAVTG